MNKIWYIIIMTLLGFTGGAALGALALLVLWWLYRSHPDPIIAMIIAAFTALGVLILAASRVRRWE